MLAQDNPGDDMFSLRTWIDQRGDELDKAWKQNPFPSLADFIAGAPADCRCPVLAELIKVDLEYRCKAGNRPSIDSYSQEFADDFARGGPDFRDDLIRYVRLLTARYFDEPPTKIGKYLVIEKIADAGQATVYRGLHPQIGKDVVVKWGHQSVEAAERDCILKEGKILAKLKHVNLAQVFDFDVWEERTYLVLEYIRGRNLVQFRDADKPNPCDAAKIMAKVGHALAYAHKQGVIHRDISPKNILMNESGEPRLIDFGMARLRHAWKDESVPRGEISGTVQYMAPEQVRGETDRIIPRTDIFGLGAVLYFLLTGKPVFTGSDITEALQRAQHGEFDREALPRAGVPRRQEAVCLKALATEPDDRYATANDFAKELEHFAHVPRRWPWVAAAAGVVLISIALVVGMSGLLSRDGRSSRANGNDTAQTDQPRFVLAHSGNQCKVPGGRLRELAKGSILAVYPLVRNAGESEPAGYVRVVDSRIGEADVESCAYADRSAPPTLEAGWRCEPVFIDYGDMRLFVAPDSASLAEAPAVARGSTRAARAPISSQIAGVHSCAPHHSAATGPHRAPHFYSAVNS